MKNIKTCIGLVVRNLKIPRDGTRRYLYDIWQPLTLLVLMTCFTAVFFAISNPRASTEGNDYFFCNADGNVQFGDYRYRPFWDPQLYFTINVAFGQFAFSTVKIIDAVWDLAIGRGGQMVAAIVAYRTLRRSLTLTMETCTVIIPTATSLYYHQIQIKSLGRLMRNMFWHWGSHHLERRQPVRSGRTRVGMQVFVCVYVLSFATMVSVMSGYRAQLTSYFGFDAEQATQLQPTSQLVRPRMALWDPHRIGRSGPPILLYDEVFFPGIPGEYFSSTELLDRSSDFEEPYGTLVDYYYTCLGLRNWIYHAQKNMSSSGYIEAHSVECAHHSCSCAFGKVKVQDRLNENQIVGKMTSNITIDGISWPLEAPPLRIAFVQTGFLPYHDIGNHSTTLNAIDYEAGLPSERSNFATFLDWTLTMFTVYMMSNGTAISIDSVKQTGRCIAQDAYSWGFSSLMLLTFCSYTILFALVLILLQTDVYWNSRHDREHQSHSMYTDVLYLAEELKAIFGGDIKAHLQSPKAFSERVEGWKQGLRLDVHELPLSRWQDWRLSRATKTVNRRDRASTPQTESLSNELRPVKPQTGGQLEIHVLTPSDQEASLQSSVEPASSFQGRYSAAVGRSAGVSASEEQGLITHAAQTTEAEEEQHASSLPPHDR